MSSYSVFNKPTRLDFIKFSESYLTPESSKKYYLYQRHITDLEKKESYRKKLIKLSDEILTKEKPLLAIKIDFNENYNTSHTVVCVNTDDYLTTVKELLVEVEEGGLYVTGLEKVITNVRHETNGVPIMYVFEDWDCLFSAIPQPVINLDLYPKIDKKQKKVKVKESFLEENLVKWLSDNGVECFRQTQVQKGRTDIWIPGACFLELKRGKITSKDFCQALRYNTSTDRKIVLVGSDVEKDVVATLESYNDLTGVQSISFVSWSSVNVYLRGLLGF